MTTYQQRTVLYFSPHQDDELLSMGIGICNSVSNGQDVHVVLCTDGSKSSVRQHLAEGRECRLHAGNHTYSLSEEDFITARDKEFRESCSALGVKGSNVHIPEDRFIDRKLTVSGSKRVIMQYLDAMGPDCVVCTLYPDPENSSQHRDHKALGYAAVELFNEGYIREIRLFTEPYYAGCFKHEMDFIRGECRPVTVSATETVTEKLKKAAAAYSRWEPEAGRYAVGYHDYFRAFDAFLKNRTAYCHVCGREAVAPEKTVSGSRYRKLIVCLDSSPDRIKNTVDVLAAIYEQRLTPDAVILWLAAPDFPDREKNLPEELVKMITEKGLSVRWCEEGLKACGQYFRTVNEFPDALVLTVDGIGTFHNQLTEKLYYSYLLNSRAVSAGMVVIALAAYELGKAKKEAAKAKRELNDIKNGWSFKSGRVLTWLPRKIKQMLWKR